MSRHSQHSNDRTFYSYKERADAGFAQSKKEVLGTDSFLPFGFCALSLNVAKDPVATPQGIIYEREAIYESLLHQKLTLTKEKEKYDEQEHKKAQKVIAEKRKLELKEQVDFINTDNAVLSDDHRHKTVDQVVGQDDRHDPNNEYSSTWAAAIENKKRRKGELQDYDKHEMAQKSFWAANATQTAVASEFKKVVVQTLCPITQKKLRVKDLVSVKFEILDQKKFDAGGERGVFCCAVTKHALVHQECCLIKPSGQVVLKSVLKKCVWPEMKCPITGKKLKDKADVLDLKAGETGFSSHNKVTAESFFGIRSRLGDDRTQQGHLPKGGYCGLK